MAMPTSDSLACILDFEITVRNVLNNRYPQAAISYCFFHLTKSIYAKIQKKGLATIYLRNPALALRMRMLSSLSFVREADVVQSNDD